MKGKLRRKTHSGASLFLIELMISILFFSITAAVFMMAFVKSDSIRKKSENLFEAQTRASTLAETIKNIEEESDLENKLLKEFPDARKMSQRHIEIYYDAQWKECKFSKKSYVLTVSWEEKDEMRSSTIKVTDSDGENLYQIPLKKWLGEKNDE